MKNNKIIKIILAFVSLVFSISLIQETYAKYQTTATGETSIKIARWNIKVNEQDILLNSAVTEAITPVFIGNDNTKADVIAPRAEGYFDIIMDTTNVDVSFRYTISTSPNLESSVTDLIVTGYSINGSEITNVDGNMTNVTNTVLYTDTNKINTVRVYIKWNDDETSTMTNADDTNASLSLKDASINALINFTQIAN